MSDSQGPQPESQQPTTTTNQSESVTIDTGRPNEEPKPSGFGETMTKVSRSLLERHIQYDPLSILFTIMVFAGGIAGYILKESVVSLVTGTIFTVLLAIGTYLEGARKMPYLLLVTLFALGATMLWRYLQNYVFMPAGLIGLLTFIMFARHCYLIYLKRQSV